MADDREDMRTDTPAGDPVAGKRRLTRWILLWEALAGALWPLAAVVLATLALILLGFPKAIGDLSAGWLHALLIAMVIVGLFLASRRAVLSFRYPSDGAVRRRLETESELPHRPLTLLDDVLSNGEDPVATALWKAHRRRALGGGTRWRLGLPRALIARVDPFGARALIGLGLIVGLVLSWGDPWSRFRDAVDVDLVMAAELAPAKVDLWVNPPVHTGQPPRLLASPDLAPDPEQVVKVPVDSMLLVTVNGARDLPSLTLVDVAGGENAAPLTAHGKNIHKIERKLATTATAVVRDGDRELLRLPLAVRADLRPSIEFEAQPKPSERQSLILSYLARDDYGIETVVALIERMKQDGTPAGDEPLQVDLPVPGVGETEVKGRGYADLTPHPWAGQPVTITLRARDEIGQTGDSDPERMILPERVFQHPVARAIIEQRKRLVARPEDRRDIAQVLMSLAVRPGRYFDDIVVFMVLKSATSRLILNDDPTQDREVVDMLWDTALRIEEGEISIAARDLRELERKLQEALANDAPLEEIERLMDQLRQAMERYLKAMAEQMQAMQRERGAEPQQIDPDRVLRREDLMKMLERARELSRSGSREAAREMLSRLQEMMENLRVGRMAQPSPQQQAFQEMMRQLREMTRKQRDLMDQTYKSHRDRAGRRDGRNQRDGQGRRQGQRGGMPRQGEGNQRHPFGARPGDPRQGQHPGQRPGGQQGGSLAEMQEQLRRQLGEFMRRLGEGMDRIPQGLGQAERSMKDAVGDLRRGDMGAATGPQGDALEQLQQGGQNLADKMREQMNQGAGNVRQSGVQGQSQRPDDRDPFGRNPSGSGGASRNDVGIPEESDVIKARKILEELRRRAGDRERPPLELDYIDRLLKRF